ncbi:MAG: C45 family peptidase [Rhodospirillales bacterium]|nr:C45 family peptidase [Rhodospirillales bacterium]
MTPLNLLDISGNPFERGLAHGKHLAKEIAENTGTYLRMFAANGLEQGDALAKGDRWLPVIREGNAAYADEMKGIAKGAGVPEGLIGMLNARYEIAFSLFHEEAKRGNRSGAIAPSAIPKDSVLRAPEGCTSFGAMPEATRDGTTLLGQNWDWLAAVHGRCVILRISRDDGPDILSLNEAGIVGGKQGLNRAGIGLVENGLVSALDGANGFCKPFHVRCREILEAETYDQALLPVVKTDRTCSANFVIGHADGEIINIETSPKLATYIYPEGGIVTHSNHFLDSQHGPSQMERISPNTLYRAERLRRRLMAHHGELDFTNIRDALSDHFGLPNSICRHPDARLPEDKRSMTNNAVVLDLNNRTLAVSDGPPCENSFVAYSFTDAISGVA